MKTYLLIVTGVIPGKKNGWRAWKGRVVIDPTHRQQIEAIEFQLRRQWGKRPALKRAAIRAAFTVTHHRGDLDGKYTTLQDAMIRAGVIANDNTRHVLRFSASARKGDRDECAVRIREIPEEPKKRRSK